MLVPLSDHDAAILLGATLMHQGVPFHFVPRRELSRGQRAVLDEVDEKLLDLRDRQRAAESPAGNAVAFSEDELALLVFVVEDCLAECGGDATEVRLHLRSDGRAAVEDVLGRLRQATALPT